MSGLVEELQRAAIDRDTSISDLLRKALLTSSKLGVDDIRDWVQSEMRGYPREDKAMPEYRHVSGLLEAYNPYHGWQPVNFKNHKAAEPFTARVITQSVAEVEQLNLSSDGELQMVMSEQMKQHLMRSLNMPAQVRLIIPRTSMTRIIDAVRTKILEWALELEQKGIRGEGISFSRQEREMAQQVTINIQEMNGSQLQAATTHSSQQMTVTTDTGQLQAFVEQLRAAMGDLQLGQQECAQLGSDIATLEAQLQAPALKTSIVKECLMSVRSILEGVAGNAVAVDAIIRRP